MSAKLDQLVKGAPPPGKHFPALSTSPIQSVESVGAPNTALADPTANLPSSPPQIYLNLLILEASLRAQWLQLRTRRRQHTFFLTLLGLWVIYFGHALFFAPREDGSGLGGSVYWVVEVTEKVCLMGGVVTGALVWGTGQWERGIRWPRRWVGTTNRGLRGFNCKLVVIKESWWRELLSMPSFLFSFGLFSSTSQGSYRFVDHTLLAESDKASRSRGHHALPNIHEDNQSMGFEEDLAPGGDCVKLLLLPKPFSPNFRENWDIYRTEYWEKENERRAILRKNYKERERKEAKKQGGWLWWTGYRGWKRGKSHDVEKIHHAGAEKRTRSNSLRSVRSGSQSRNISRSTTPTTDLDDGASGHNRKGSVAKRKKAAPTPRITKLTPSGSRSATPEVSSPLVRDNSFTSVSSLESERSGAMVGGDGDSVRSLKGSLRSSVRNRSSGRGANKTDSA